LDNNPCPSSVTFCIILLCHTQGICSTSYLRTRTSLFVLVIFWPVISIHSAILGDMTIYDTTGTDSSSHNGLCVPHCQRPFFLITLKNLPFRNKRAWQTTCAPSDRRARLALGSRFATPCAERVHLHLLILTPAPIPLSPPRSDGRNPWYDGLFLAEAWFPGFLQLLEVIISGLGTAPHSMGLVFRLLPFSWNPLHVLLVFFLVFRRASKIHDYAYTSLTQPRSGWTPICSHRVLSSSLQL